MLNIFNHQKDRLKLCWYSNLSQSEWPSSRTNDNKWWQWCEERGTLIYNWWECKLGRVVTLKISLEVIQKAGIVLPYDLARSLLHIWLLYHNRDTSTFMPIAAAFTVVRKWTQPKCSSVDKRVMTMWHTYIMEYYTAE